MTRKLVTIRTVAALDPIPGADLIEVATVDGWQCVVKKGEFKVGQKGLYFEIDSFLPSTDERFKFLEKNFTNFNKQYGARVRTIRLRKQVSQGLLLPLSQFPEVKPGKWGEDADFADLLKVVKWEREEPAFIANQASPRTYLGKLTKKLGWKYFKKPVKYLETKFPKLFFNRRTSNFPSFVPKTDENRIQNIIGREFLNHSFYEATIKLDGSSLTMYRNGKKFGVCSRNYDLAKDPTNQFWAMAIKYDVEQALKKLGLNIALQGELMGPGVQGNREGLPCLDWYIFKVWDIDAKRYYGKEERKFLLCKLAILGCNLKVAPSIGTYYLMDTFKTVGDYLKFAEGPSLKAKTREGVVFCNLDGTHSFKVISNSYLLKEDN